MAAVFEPPAELGDAAILALVRGHWRSDADRAEHLAVGFGAHHWRVDAGGSAALFATYDRFGQRHTPTSLEAAYRGAIELAERGLEFVLAPVRTRTGAGDRAGGRGSTQLHALGRRHGGGRRAPDRLGDGAREHRRPGAAARRDPPDRRSLAWRPLVQADLGERLAGRVAEPWPSGPYGEPARAAVARSSPTSRSGPPATWTWPRRPTTGSGWRRTGRPHTANQLRTAAGIRFVDWESLKLAPRERDLSALVQAGYGDRVDADQEMVELFDLEWRLSEIDEYARWFAASHTGSADDRIAYGGLLEELARGPWWSIR